MRPTFLPGDRLLVDRKAYRYHPPGVGDLVVHESLEEPGQLLLKRVVGIGRDRLAILREGILRLPSGSSIAEEEVPRAGTGSIEEVQVPAGYVFVLSDSPRGGRDSRQFGPVDLRRLWGRPWFRYAPKDRCGPLS